MRTVLVIDNASWLRSHGAQALLSSYKNRVLVIWLPPYCPMRNAIERFRRRMRDTAYDSTPFESMIDMADIGKQALSAAAMRKPAIS